jgi:photosystem II stability/assembly factor-like uncharacterized protein
VKSIVALGVAACLGLVGVLTGCSGGHQPSARPATVVSTAGGRSLAGFEPLSFTAVSEDDFWVLGSLPCPGGRCASILRTADGGGSFTTVSAPPLPVTDAAVTPTLRFADRLDGFAFVEGRGGGFYSTHDGGAAWNRVSLGAVLAFATGGGSVYAVTAHCSQQGCSHYRFERSHVSADVWRATAMPFAPDGSVLDLNAHGLNLWLLGTAASGKDELARSSDGGRTFVTGPGPCVPGLGGELAATSAANVWAVCPTGTLAGAWRSNDGGISFGRLRTPQLVNSAALAPASADTAVLSRNGAGTGLLRTTDGGAHWTAATVPGPETFVPFVGFTDADVGAALVQTASEHQELWRTTDGGARWSRVQFAR